MLKSHSKISTNFHWKFQKCQQQLCSFVPIECFMKEQSLFLFLTLRLFAICLYNRSASSPIAPEVEKTTGVKVAFSTCITLSKYFLFFSSSCRLKVVSTGFALFVGALELNTLMSDVLYLRLIIEIFPPYQVRTVRNAPNGATSITGPRDTLPVRPMISVRSTGETSV
eukprot:sb/3472338/